MPAKQSISRFKVVHADVDGLREHYANTIKPVEITPLSGNRSISVEDTHFSIGDFDIWAGRSETGMDVRFSDPPDVYALYLPVAGRMEIDLHGERVLSEPETLVACDLRRVRSLRIHSGRGHMGVAFSRKAFTRALSDLIEAPVMQDIELLPAIHLQTKTGKLVSGMADLLWRELVDAPELMVNARSTDLFLKTMMTLLLENVPHQYSRLLDRNSSPAIPRHVKRAIDFMMAHSDQPLDLDQLAREAGVSKRALQLGFQQFKDMTPIGYLRKLRLEKAKSELEAPVVKGAVSQTSPSETASAMSEDFPSFTRKPMASVRRNP